MYDIGPLLPAAHLLVNRLPGSAKVVEPQVRGSGLDDQ
jgi:hypothetical protein